MLVIYSRIISADSTRPEIRPNTKPAPKLAFLQAPKTDPSKEPENLDEVAAISSEWH